MSKHLSASVTSTAYKITRTVIDIECDVCKRIIPAKRSGQRYYTITTGHNDWGNDSIDSVQTRDVCPDCVTSFIAEFLDEENITGYLNLETEYAYPKTSTKYVDTPPKEDEVFFEERDFW